MIQELEHASVLREKPFEYALNQFKILAFEEYLHRKIKIACSVQA